MNAELFTASRYGASANAYLGFGLTTAFLAGMTTSLANSNLPRRALIRYGAFNRFGGEGSLPPLSAFPVLWGKRLGMVPYTNIVRIQTDDPDPENFHPIWPYGNDGT